MFLRSLEQPTNPWTCAQTKRGLAASLPSFAAPHEGRPAVAVAAAAALPDVASRPASRRLHRRPSTAAVTVAAGDGDDCNTHDDGGGSDFASRLTCLRKSLEHQGHDRSAFPKPPLAVTLRAIASPPPPPPPPPPVCSSAVAGGAPRRTLHCRCCAAKHAAAGGGGGVRHVCARLTHGGTAASKAGTAALLTAPAASADAAAEAEAEVGGAAAGGSGSSGAGISPSFLSAAVLRMNEAWQPRHDAVLQVPPQVRRAAAGGGGSGGGTPQLHEDLQQPTAAKKTPQQVEHTLRELSKVVHDLRQRVACGSQPPERQPRLSFHVAPDGEATGADAAAAAAAAADAKAKARRQAASVRARPAAAAAAAASSPDEGDAAAASLHGEAAAAAAQPPSRPPSPRGGGGGRGVQQKQTAAVVVVPAARVVRRASSVARWRRLGSEDKQALAQRRREAAARTLEASLARTGRALEERLGRTEANKRRLERNKKTPQQRDWLALCAHAARVRVWGRAAEEGRARRSDADSDGRRMDLLRRVFMRYFIRRRAKREKAERRVLQFVRMWRMRRARQMYAHHASVVRGYLQGLREMGIVKQNVSRYLADVRACQACVRRFLTRQKAQLELTALHFNDVEERLVEEVQRGTVVHDVAWLRREIRQNLLMKNLTAPPYKSHKDVNVAALEDAVAPFVAHHRQQQQQPGGGGGEQDPSLSSSSPPPPVLRVPNPAQATRFTFSAVSAPAAPQSPLSPASHATAAAPTTPVAADAAAAGNQPAAAAAAAAPVAAGAKGKPGRKKGKGGAQGGGGGGPKTEAVVDEATKARFCDCLDLLGQFGADRLKDDGLRRLGEETGLIVQRPFVQADVKKAYLKRVVKLRSQQYASAVEGWRRDKERLRAAQQLEEARCMLSGEKGAVSVVPPRPHLRLFMPREEMLALVNHCRLAMGLFVANVQV